MGNASGLIIAAAVMFTILGLISLFAHIYNLNNIKARTVGDGQHGTARFADKREIRKTYKHVQYEPQIWREQAMNGEHPTMPDGNPLPQGIIVGCKGKSKTVALVDDQDVHALMIGAAGVGKQHISFTRILNMHVLRECHSYLLIQKVISIVVTETSLKNIMGTKYLYLICVTRQNLMATTCSTL